MPTRNTPWPNGTPCWLDYGASSVDAAKEFYGSLFGWEYDAGDNAFGYIVATKDGESASALAPLMSEGDSPAWTTYFAADDAAVTAGRIQEAGGRIIMAPMAVGAIGTMAIALDPQGNPFGLWQAGEHTGVGIYNEPGALVWNEAAVDDPAAARKFYSAVFGFSFDEIPGAEGFATFTTGGGPLGDLGRVAPGTPKGWTVCFAVASVDDAVAKIEAAGGKVTTAPRDTEFGRFAVVEDPWGAPFSVMQMPA